VYADESAYVAKPRMYRTISCTGLVALRPAPGRDPVPVSNTPAATAAAPAEDQAPATAMLSINSNQPGAAIEVDGLFVGNAPTTLELAAGVHQVVLRHGSSVWRRNLQITSGTVTITARLGSPVVQRAAEK